MVGSLCSFVNKQPLISLARLLSKETLMLVRALMTQEIICNRCCATQTRGIILNVMNICDVYVIDFSATPVSANIKSFIHAVYRMNLLV